MAIRKSISKGTRYAIFARDNFTCRYCGRQAGTVVLVVDHIKPVAHGGDNDPSNLITSCEDCNAGKGAKSPATAVPTTIDLRRVTQERLELEAAAHAVAASRQAREQFLQATIDLLCEIKGADTFDARTAETLSRYVEEFGAETVRGWIERTYRRFRFGANDRQVGRYVSGIRRSVLRQRAEEEARHEAERMLGDPTWTDFTSR